MTESKNSRVWAPRNPLILAGLVAGVIIILGTVLWLSSDRSTEPEEAPEAQRVLDLQTGMPFQILIPAYLPKVFQRAEMEIDVSQSGPGGEPMVQLTYRTERGEAVFIREWVPVNPDKEVLAASRPVETKWGQGWFLKQGERLIVIWVDIGPLRASIYTTSPTVLTQEELLVVADTMGPASNRQVFSFVVDPPHMRAVSPPPPLEIPVNVEGVQEVELIITPGGYSPLRFSVRKGVPARLIFRQLGQVGCGNELNFPTADGGMASLTLASATDTQTLDFTPQQVGEYQFFCGHIMFRGVMTVRE